uniref:PH domain-containing protein n=1 Tax=Rhabditophanes sp. KR3021 TaxID=114890 RepID=A0AC35UCY7_9BILA
MSEYTTSSLDDTTCHERLSSPSSGSTTSATLNSASTVFNIEQLLERLAVTEYENQQLMANQGFLVAESNKRTEIQLCEIKSLQQSVDESFGRINQLKSICSMLEDDCRKAKKLGREWEKFGRYSNDLIKQEVNSYNARLHDLISKNDYLVNENKELKRLCLYLDGQRYEVVEMAKQGLFKECSDKENSEEDDGIHSLSSKRQSMENETRLEVLTKEMQTSISSAGEEGTFGTEKELNDSSSQNKELLHYIQYLEKKISSLEIGVKGNDSQMSAESGQGSNGSSEIDDSDLIRVSPLLDEELFYSKRTNSKHVKILSKVSVNEEGLCNLEHESGHMRVLSKIDEDGVCEMGTRDYKMQSNEQHDIPPPMGNISESIGRLSRCTGSDVSLNSIKSNGSILSLNNSSAYRDQVAADVLCHYNENSLNHLAIDKTPPFLQGKSKFANRFESLITPISKNAEIAGVSPRYMHDRVNGLPIRHRTGQLISTPPNSAERVALHKACLAKFKRTTSTITINKETQIVKDSKTGTIKAELTVI